MSLFGPWIPSLAHLDDFSYGSRANVSLGIHSLRICHSLIIVCTIFFSNFPIKHVSKRHKY